MKSFAIGSAVLMLCAATAAAGDRAVSKSTLEGMGLAGMHQMSDEDGLAVRGMGLFDSLGIGGLFGGSFGGGFDLPDGFGDVGIPAEVQLGNALQTAIGSELNLENLGIPGDLGIPNDLGLGSLGGFGF